jgi:hypothetical protein
MAETKPTLNWEQPDENQRLYALPTGWETCIFDDILEDGDEVIMRIHKTTHAQQLAEAAYDHTKRSWKELVPEELHQFEDIFNEEASQCFPESKHWGHTIDLLEGAPAVLDCKVYPLMQQEQEALDKFIVKHLEKGI